MSQGPRSRPLVAESPDRVPGHPADPVRRRPLAPGRVPAQPAGRPPARPVVGDDHPGASPDQHPRRAAGRPRAVPAAARAGRGLEPERAVGLAEARQPPNSCCAWSRGSVGRGRPDLQRWRLADPADAPAGSPATRWPAWAWPTARRSAPWRCSATSSTSAEATDPALARPDWARVLTAPSRPATTTPWPPTSSGPPSDACSPTTGAGTTWPRPIPGSPRSTWPSTNWAAPRSGRPGLFRLLESRGAARRLTDPAAGAPRPWRTRRPTPGRRPRSRLVQAARRLGSRPLGGLDDLHRPRPARADGAQPPTSG